MPIDLGFHGLGLQTGEHLCGLYAEVRQRDQILKPFLQAGLAPVTSAFLTAHGDAQKAS
jgi:hypothetical protein